MPRGYIRWEQPRAGLAPAQAAEAADVADALPAHEPPLPPHDEAIFLLHTAAEIEHALLVQYLYAAFSLGERTKRKADVVSGRLTHAQYDAIFGPDAMPDGWGGVLLRIAKEEMGHLLTVQNLLRLLGGPLNFDREDFPFRTDYYPFPFTLEPLNKDSLAKYVAAERPEKPDLQQYPKVPEIDARARGTNRTQPINRVGPLYAKLILLFDDIPENRFRPESADTLQGTPVEWDDPNGALIIRTFGGTAMEAREAAKRALKEIAEQGEGPSGTGTVGSHFERFYKMYDQFPETNGRYGPLGWQPALGVPHQPSTAPKELITEEQEDGRITAPVAWRWAQMSNVRYRMLLGYLSHALHLERTGGSDARSELILWTFNEMFRLRFLSDYLTSLPRKREPFFQTGLPATAAVPFELPYTLNLPDCAKERWNVQRTLIEASELLLKEIEKIDQSAEGKGLITAIRSTDQITLMKINEFDSGSPPPPTGPKTGTLEVSV